MDGKGQIITFLLTPGQQHEISVAEQLMEQGAIHQLIGQPRILPKRIVGEKGYKSAKFRTYCENVASNPLLLAVVMRSNVDLSIRSSIITETRWNA